MDTGRSTFRWRRVARAAVPPALATVAACGLAAASFWAPSVPQPLARRLTEGFLRALLVGYAGALALAVSAAVGLGLALRRARRRGVRRPLLARLLLLAASALLGMAALEAMAGAWLAWAHRMPRLPSRFPEASAPGETSVVVIGGSSALGFPYDPTLSIGQIVAWQLGRAMPGRRFALDIRARRGATLERMHQELAGLRRRPDLMIIYSGNNEFLSRFDGRRDAGLSEAPTDPILGPLYRASLASPLCRMIYETASRHRLGGPAPRFPRHALFDPPPCTPSEYSAIAGDFRRRLGAIVAYCRRVGAEPVLVIPPGNESGFEPNRTVLPEAVTAGERAALARSFAAARALEASDPAASRARYLGLVERQPRFAEAHFRLARLLEAAGDRDAALRHYIAARDLDGFPIRVTTEFQRIIRGVAARHGCLLVDGPAVLRPVTPLGILDDHAIHDAHHPTLAGHVALARAVVEGLRARRALGWDRGEAPAFGPAECAAHFGVDREVWTLVCNRTWAFYRDGAARYDTSERLAKMRRYGEAARRIASGVPPEEVGVAGIGIPPARRGGGASEARPARPAAGGDRSE